MANRMALLVITLLVLAGGGQAQAQQAVPVDVFVEQNPATGEANIYFVDALSGLSTVIKADNGEGFTLLGDYVIYRKPQSGAVMRANADGSLEPHPFIQRTEDTRSIHWVVSPDRQAVAWVQTSMAGVSEVFLAWADGRDQRKLAIPPPAPPLNIEPLALSNGLAAFFYDAAHPPAAVAYDYYVDLAQYRVAEGLFFSLPQEPNCPCGAAITPDGGILARLESPDGQGPFGLHIWDLAGGADILIPAAGLPYPIAGDLVLNGIGTFAAYSVSNGAQYGLVLVDVVIQQQVLVFDPGPTRYRPVAFIDDDSALLLTADDGTYKLDLVSGELRRVSTLIYLGTINASA